MKKVCLIGCGDHARHVYWDAILRCRAEMDQIEFCACCDVEKERARDFAEKICAPHFYTDYFEMVAQECPDAAILVTPYHLTAKIAADMMHAGCAVLIEKPPAEDYPSCCVLASVAKETGCMNQVAFNRRHIPIVRELRAHIGGKPILHIDYHMYRINRTETHFYSTAVHGVDLVCKLMGQPCKKGSILYGAIPGYEPGVINILMQLMFEGGATAQLSFCPVSGLVSESMTVTTEQGSYLVEIPIWSDQDTGKLIFSDHHGVVKQIVSSDGPHMFESNGFYWQLHQFLEALLCGNPSEDDICSSLETMRLTDCIRMRKTDYIA